MGRSYQDGNALSYPLVAVCIDKDMNSPNALKWAIDSLVQKRQTIVLVHVNTKGASGGVEDGARFKQPTIQHIKELFLPFRIFCVRKDVQCKAVVVDEHDVAKGITKFSEAAAIDKLVIGATARGWFRFKAVDVPTTVLKGVPDFCTVHVINKGKVWSTRSAIGAAPWASPLRSQIQSQQRERQDDHPRRPSASCSISSPHSTCSNHLNCPQTAFLARCHSCVVQDSGTRGPYPSPGRTEPAIGG